MKKIILYFVAILFLSILSVSAQQDSIARVLIESPPNGVFYSFSDFRNGIVSMRDSVTTTITPRKKKIWIGTNSVTPRNSEHKRTKRIKRLWGFADGKNVYIWNELDFFPLEIKGDTIGFEGYGPYDYNPNVNAAVSALFGSIGVATYSISLASKAEAKRQFYWMDFEEASRYGEEGYKALEFIADLSCDVILYRRSKKEMESKISLIVNDDIEFDFVPDSYKTLNIDESRLLKVCLALDPENCSVIDLGGEKKVYIKISELKDSKEIQISKVGDSQGEFESVTPKKKEKKRG